jgi:hypothetical protein
MAVVQQGEPRIKEHKPSAIILKSYGSHHVAELIWKLDVYAALRHLAVIAPQLYAVVGPPTHEYASLLLEDAGTPLPGTTWNNVALAAVDKCGYPFF